MQAATPAPPVPLPAGTAAAGSGAGPSSPPSAPSVQGRPAKRPRPAASASNDGLLSEVVKGIQQSNQLTNTLLYLLLNPAQQHG